MRVVTYPASSRFWLRATTRWLSLGGLGPEQPRLVQSARQRVRELPSDHPIRLSFESNYESQSAVGIADAYFHPCENPLRPLAWQRAVEEQGWSSLSKTTMLILRAPLLTISWGA